MAKTLCVHIANVTGDTAQTGLVDYAALLSKKQQEVATTSNIHSIFFTNCELGTAAAPKEWPYVYEAQHSYESMAARFPQEAFIQHIQALAKAEESVPLLVCHMGVRTGAVLTPETLRQFPVIIISHEFELLNANQRRYRVEQMLAAARIIFTTESERLSALESIAAMAGYEKAEEIRQRSIIRPVPSNIISPKHVKHPNERANDIVVFGTLRERKGLNKMPMIAKAMKDDPYFKGRSVRIVGNILTRNGGRGLEILKDLLFQTFALKKEDLKSLSLEETVELTNVLEGMHLAAKPLSTKVISLFSEDFIDRKIPLHIQLRQTPQQVRQVLINNRYSFLPMPRGATKHSGTLAASLEHGMITFVCRSKIEDTPPHLANGSVYLLEKASDILTVIKAHEAIVRHNNCYEEIMISKGASYKRMIGWKGLVELTNSLIRDAIKESCFAEEMTPVKTGSIPSLV